MPTYCGSMHSLEIIYTKEVIQYYLEGVIDKVLWIHANEPPGDILVFLTNNIEVEEVCEKIRQYVENVANVGPVNVVPMYEELSHEMQQRVFEAAPAPRQEGRHVGRKIVVSTNFVQSCVTIPGIRYVVDPGLDTKTMCIPFIRPQATFTFTSQISKAEADQRARYACQTQPGKCFRLYSEEEFEALEL